MFQRTGGFPQPALCGLNGFLVEPRQDAFAQGMARLAQDPELRLRLGDAARAVARERYCLPALEQSILRLYSWIESLPKAVRQH